MVRRLLAVGYRSARRIAVVVVGVSVLLFGVALVVLPGPAFVVIPVGLAILSLEFTWARRWLRRLREGGDQLVNMARGKSTEPD